MTGNAFFTVKKDDWYEIKKGTKIWKSEKTNKFWEQIKNKKMARGDNIFSHYIFPEFQDFNVNDNTDSTINEEQEVYIAKKDVNFWWKDQNLAFYNHASFFRCQFLGKTTFAKVNFFENANFNWAIFLEWTNFFSGKFANKARFEGAIFHQGADFSFINFQNRFEFSNARSLESVNFENTVFAGESDFSNAIFLGEVDFMSASFTRNHKIFFEETSFLYWNRKRGDKSVHPSVLFLDVDFPNTVIFRQTDLSRACFNNANVEKANFEECKFGDLYLTNRRDTLENLWQEINEQFIIFRIILFENKNNREVLWDEYELKKQNTKRPFQASKYESVETRYRQFKKNFEEKKDWETAGNFYHGEMEMRLLKYNAERKEKAIRVSWIRFPKKIWIRLFYNRGKTFLLRWYKWISCYNENPFRALSWLFWIVVLFSILFLFLLRSPEVRYNNEKSISFAFTGAIPLYRLPQDEEEKLFTGDYGNATKWIYYSEIFFSTIVWALLILSIRQKFRR